MPKHYGTSKENKVDDMKDMKDSKDKPKKKGSSWMSFLADFRKKNPSLKGPEVMKKAAVAYKKSKK